MTELVDFHSNWQCLPKATHLFLKQSPIRFTLDTPCATGVCAIRLQRADLLWPPIDYSVIDYRWLATALISRRRWLLLQDAHNYEHLFNRFCC